MAATNTRSRDLNALFQQLGVGDKVDKKWQTTLLEQLIEEGELYCPEDEAETPESMREALEAGRLCYDDGGAIDEVEAKKLCIAFEEEAWDYLDRYKSLSPAKKQIMSDIYSWIVENHTEHYPHVFIRDPQNPNFLKLILEYRTSFPTCLLKPYIIDDAGTEKQAYELTLAVIMCRAPNKSFLVAAYQAYLDGPRALMDFKIMMHEPKEMDEVAGAMLYGLWTRCDIDRLHIGQTDKGKKQKAADLSMRVRDREEGQNGPDEFIGRNRFLQRAKQINPPSNWRTFAVLQFPDDCPKGIINACHIAAVAGHGSSLNTPAQMQWFPIGYLSFPRPPASQLQIDHFYKQLQIRAKQVAEKLHDWPDFEEDMSVSEFEASGSAASHIQDLIDELQPSWSVAFVVACIRPGEWTWNSGAGTRDLGVVVDDVRKRAVEYQRFKTSILRLGGLDPMAFKTGRRPQYYPADRRPPRTMQNPARLPNMFMPTLENKPTGLPDMYMPVRKDPAEQAAHEMEMQARLHDMTEFFSARRK